MTKRVSNKKGTTHQKGVKPARSAVHWGSWAVKRFLKKAHAAEQLRKARYGI